MQADALYTENKLLYAGDNIIRNIIKPVEGEIKTIGNELYYRISNYDMMPPFLMNIVSSSDLWMFISSTGALTAGRKNPDNALFPYYTDDRIHDSYNVTGHKALLFVTKENVSFLWEPFARGSYNIYNVERRIYKNLTGSKVIFEEYNHDLEVVYQYSWQNCDKFGFVLKTGITNTNSSHLTVNILNGIQNILPPGVDRKFQLEYSTLLDGYKKNELLEDSGLGLYTLSSIPTDKAEPAEALKAAVVWSAGLEDAVVLLSSMQLEEFKRSGKVAVENFSKGVRGAYLLQAEFEIPKGTGKEWYIAADVNKDHAGVAALSELLKAKPILVSQIESELLKNISELNQIISSADGCQLSRDSLKTFRHFSNVLFNVMRGGIFDNNYVIDKDDFISFVKKANRPLWEETKSILESLPEKIDLQLLLQESEKSADKNLQRLCYEYLPLTFSRRHGDPSRPWNLFSIDVKDEDGGKVLNYQGNWRDIFQNWEALALSYPNFACNMIVKFVNASTADGYNPYKVTRDGFEWEVLDPSDPWSHIGYWGDHQVIYLLKLLELSYKYNPELLESFLEKEIFTYANVPYRIKSYDQIVSDPHNTINFDFESDKKARSLVNEIGEDGKYVHSKNGEIYQVNFSEKLLLPVLVKMSNFIPEAGIWLNTQRPEWNDANNALVGYGVSMVTLYQLRRYISFITDIFKKSAFVDFKISEEVHEFLVEVTSVLSEFRPLLQNKISDKARKEICDRLGRAGSSYRTKIYANSFSGMKKSFAQADIISFLNTALEYVDHSISANKRDDDLYHSYNLIRINSDGIVIRHLYEMLEGQAAVLASGRLSVDESILLLNALRKSKLYRKDQNSYMLYPERELPAFIEKNIIPERLIEKSQVLQTLLNYHDKTIITRDVNGKAHFNSRFRNVSYLKQALAELSKSLTITPEEIELILHIYETVFDHQSFTGRSGTFYKYEGLGSIYWHMVSKLLVSVQDVFYRACTEEMNSSVLRKIKDIYYEIQEGIGEHKSPESYGAFPVDPHSHTPSGMGAQQPGMTGQVKEDIITRFGELGVIIEEGKIRFDSSLLNEDEFLNRSQVYAYYDVDGKYQTLMLNEEMFSFSICQVPVIYIKSEEERIILTRRNEREEEIKGLVIGKEDSSRIFKRDGEITKIEVLINH